MSDRIPNHDKPPPQNLSSPKTSSDMTSVAHSSLVSRNRKDRVDSKLCPTDDEAIIPKNATQTKFSKQSWNYIVRSGVAGGLAGCAVCSSRSDISL